jgi:hypothetical protein
MNNQTPKTIIELSYPLDSYEEEKLKTMLGLLFDDHSDDSISIYSGNFYSMESAFADTIASEIFQMKADDALG